MTESFKSGSFFVVTPKFNRQRILRHGISSDTPYLLKVYANTLPIKPALDEIPTYGDIDIWELRMSYKALNAAMFSIKESGLVTLTKLPVTKAHLAMNLNCPAEYKPLGTGKRFLIKGASECLSD